MLKFNINVYFQILGILYGPLDVLQIRIRSIQKLYSCVLRFLIVAIAVKQFAAAQYANQMMPSFYLAALTFAQGYALCFCHMCLISSYFAWVSFSMHFFCRINQNLDMSYWIHLLPRLHDESCPNDRRLAFFEKRKRMCIGAAVYKKLEHFFYLSSVWACFLVGFFSLFVAQLALLYYLITFSALPTKLPFWVFWSIGLGNYVFMTFLGTHAFVVTIAVSFYFVFLTYSFQLKLSHLCALFDRINSFHSSPISLARANSSKLSHPKRSLFSHRKLDQGLSHTTMVLMDMIKVDAFWRPIIGVNYLGCQGTITLLLVLVYMSTSLMIQASFSCLAFLLHTVCLTMPLWMAGQVSWLVSRHPLKCQKITISTFCFQLSQVSIQLHQSLASSQLTTSQKMKMNELTHLLQTSGFSCFGIFKIQPDTIYQVGVVECVIFDWQK